MWLFNTVVTGLVALLFLLSSCADEMGTAVQNEHISGTPVEEDVDEEVLLYELIPETYIAESGRIGRNQVISGLLLDNGFTFPEVHRIIENNQGTFNPARVRSGNRYTFYRANENSVRPEFLVYEHDNRLTYIFSLEEEPGVSDYMHEIRREMRYVSGVVESSLWEAVVEAGASPLLALELSEIYAWSIDFFGLQKGDRFSVVYEDLYNGDKASGIGSIYGAGFTHAGREIIAVPFIQDSVAGFFDAEGNSLRKAFLKAPLIYSRISSGFSHSRMHPILRIRRPHLGVDYAAAAGTPVVSIGDGVVTSTAYETASGRIVRIRHNSVYSTAYLHLQGFGPGIRGGVPVTQGQVIGYVGSSGLSTGPHLDFRVYRNGSPVDPLKVESPPVEPVKEENIKRYIAVRDVVLSLLGTIELREPEDPTVDL